MSKNNVKYEASKIVAYQGLLPPPAMLREFQSISDNLPEKIIEWADDANKRLEKSLILQEKQINADIELRKQIHLDEYVCQKKMIDIEHKNYRLALIGLVMTFTLALSFLALSFWMLYCGNQVSALIAALPSLAIILSTVFKNFNLKKSRSGG